VRLLRTCVGDGEVGRGRVEGGMEMDVRSDMAVVTSERRMSE